MRLKANKEVVHYVHNIHSTIGLMGLESGISHKGLNLAKQDGSKDL